MDFQPQTPPNFDPTAFDAAAQTEMANQMAYIMEFTQLLETAIKASKDYDAGWAAYRKEMETHWSDSHTAAYPDTYPRFGTDIFGKWASLWKARVAFSAFVESHTPDPTEPQPSPVEVRPAEAPPVVIQIKVGDFVRLSEMVDTAACHFPQGMKGRVSKIDEAASTAYVNFDSTSGWFDLKILKPDDFNQIYEAIQNEDLRRNKQ